MFPVEKKLLTSPKEVTLHHFFLSGIGQKNRLCCYNLWRF
ncbi:hypothetical protein BEL55_002428 [Salmonella enterica subsp. enterica serovar Waycross]|nr:hypothetical protein [Salmonella enterica subsp. enterica serovar Waycross]